MFNRSEKYDDRFRDHMRMPLFFKLWFGFLFVMFIAIFSTTLFILYNVFTDPAMIGRYAGEVVSGFEEKVNP